MIFGSRFFVGESVSVMTKSTGTQMSSHTPMLAATANVTGPADFGVIRNGSTSAF
jgi:hypothetical protein